MNQPVSLQLLLADSQVCQWYQSTHLDDADTQRIQRTPALAQRPDWQVSRFLKQHTSLPILSLSHSHQLAALLAASCPISAGVDVEKIRPRNFFALAQWVCNEAEIAYLQSDVLTLPERFYQLWCVKEALLKATNQSFPDEMQAVGYHFDEVSHLIGLRVDNLNTDAKQTWHGLTALINTITKEKWAIATVWQGTAQLHWHYFGTLSPESISHIQMM